MNMPRRTIGDLIRRKTVAPKASASVTVDWTWSNESQGLVQWSFKNNSTEQVAFTLFRNGYYFCGAFGASIYVSNPEFGISYAPTVTPLTDQGAQYNTPPLGIINFPTPIVCFVFVLAPGASYSVLEGGFSSLVPPNGATIYEVTNPVPGTYCIGYDPASVTQWNLQTGENLSGYSPNPSPFAAISWTPSSGSPNTVEFPVTVSTGPCTSTPTPNNCTSFLDQASLAFQAGDYLRALEAVVGFIFCMTDSGAIGLGTVLKAVVEEARKRR